MSDGAKVRSEAIAEFETALGRFAQVALERAKAAETAIRRTAEQLEERRGELRRELVRLQDEIADADDDEDTSQTKRRYEETEEALSNVRKWQRSVDASVQSYKRESVKLQDLGTGTTVEARAYLRRVLDDLAAYFALQHDGAGASAGVSGDLIDIGLLTPSESRATFDPSSFLLPVGYVWVPIADIDTVQELADVSTEDTFKKVPYEEMRRGFEVLRTEILPAMNDSADSFSHKDTFAHRDAAAEVPYERGVVRVYEAFFGDEPIYLERGRSDKLFAVSNGRHRIKVAMDAGWTAVPVKMSDLRR